MRKSESKRIWFFVGILAFAAYTINYYTRQRNNRPPVPNQRSSANVHPAAKSPVLESPRLKAAGDSESSPTVPQKTPEELAREQAAERARFIARYLNVSSPANTTRIIAVAACSGGSLNPSLAHSIASRFRSESVRANTTLFTPQIVTDGLFDELFQGSGKIAADLELNRRNGLLVLAKESIEFSSNPSLANVLTASLSLEIRAFDLSSMAQSKSWTFAATGAGFNESDARSLAQERLSKRMASDESFSLASIPNYLQ